MDRLLAECKGQQALEGESGALPIVSLDLFFEGNSDESSIGCNLIPHPSIPQFYQTLQTISRLKEVQSIFIEVSEIDSSTTTSGEIVDMSFINNSEGWLFTDDSYIYKTVDGGYTWEYIYDSNHKFGGDYGSIFFVDANIGYGILTAGIGNINLYKTVDGGPSWAPVVETTRDVGLNALAFHGTNLGFTVGPASMLDSKITGYNIYRYRGNK